MLYKLLINIAFGICVGIYCVSNFYLCIFFILLVAVVNKFIFSSKRIYIIGSIIGCFAGYLSAYYCDRNFTHQGTISYIGNNCVFLENKGLYYVNSTSELSLCDDIKFTSYGNVIKKINSKSHGSLILPFVANHRKYIKDLCLKSNYYGFWIAILLGDKSYIESKDLKSLFESSTYHLIVISGFHLSLVYYVVYKSFIWIPKKSKIINYYSTIYSSWDIIPHSFACLVCVYYFLITLSGISSLRAIMMILMKKSGYSNKSILLSLMIISLIFSPSILYNRGFLLSYLITLLLLEKQSNLDISLFASTITRLVNPFSIVNNVIGTVVMYVLLPIAFVAVVIGEVKILNFFDSIIEVILRYLPRWHFTASAPSYRFIELIAFLHYLYIYTLNAKILYVSFIVFVISMILSK